MYQNESYVRMYGAWRGAWLDPVILRLDLYWIELLERREPAVALRARVAASFRATEAPKMRLAFVSSGTVS